MNKTIRINEFEVAFDGDLDGFYLRKADESGSFWVLVKEFNDLKEIIERAECRLTLLQREKFAKSKDNSVAVAWDEDKLTEEDLK